MNRLIGFASSHHRLLWIHPFSDGNGRVARLFTIAYGHRIGVDVDGLWTVTRAFGRNRAAYDDHLALADRPRRNDLDGRGPLSQEDLGIFCRYFLQCCLDQITYMKGVLELEHLRARFQRYMHNAVEDKKISKASGQIMDRIFFQGELGRGEVKDICHVQQRRATQIIKELLDAKFVHSATTYGPLRLKVTVDLANNLFPALT